MVVFNGAFWHRLALSCTAISCLQTHLLHGLIWLCLGQVSAFPTKSTHPPTKVYANRKKKKLKTNLQVLLLLFVYFKTLEQHPENCSKTLTVAQFTLSFKDFFKNSRRYISIKPNQCFITRHLSSWRARTESTLHRFIVNWSTGLFTIP